MKSSTFLLKQGTISSVLTVLLLVLSLLFVNWQVNVLGMKMYGLLILLLSAFGTINMLNVGIGTAMVNYYSKYGQDKTVFWSIFSTSFLFLLIISTVILTISSLFYQSIFNALGVGQEGLDIMAFYGFALIGISRLLSSITTSYWTAKVDYLKLKLFGFINIYLSITFILIFYSVNISINASLFYAGVINFIFIVSITLQIIIRHTNLLTLPIATSIKLHAKEFMMNGLQLQGLSIINNISNPIINVLVNTQFGLEAVSLFDIALKLLRSGRQIIVSATEPFFGKMTQLHNQNKKLLMRLLVIKYTKYMMGIALIYALATFLLSHYILTVWIGLEIADEVYKIVNIIAIGFAVNITTSIIYNKYLAIQSFRKYILIHQLLLLLMATLPLLISIESLYNYSFMYSFAYIVSSLYLLFIFYFHPKAR